MIASASACSCEGVSFGPHPPYAATAPRLQTHHTTESEAAFQFRIEFADTPNTRTASASVISASREGEREVPTKYDDATKAKAVRLSVDHRGDYDSEWATIAAVSARWV